MSQSMKVLLFGTSGNPPTGRDGHSGIVDYFASLGHFDELWVLPVYRHMFAQKREAMAAASAPTYDDRIEMCRLAFERYSSRSCKVRVLRTEQDVFNEILAARRQAGDTSTPTRCSTYDVVKHLVKSRPDIEFSLLVGSDTYQDLRRGKWRDSEALMKTVSVVVVDRLGVRPENEDLLTGIEVHHPPLLTDVSSTKIRDASARELIEGTLAVECPVLEYMRERRLYGFGRQSWFDRLLMEASAHVSKRRWLVAGTTGLLAVTTVALIIRRRGDRGACALPR